MKFTVSSSALLSLLATTGRVINSKNTMPILEYYLLTLKDNKLEVTASDLETTIVGSIAVDSVESEGVIAAPHKMMLDTLKEFPEMPITFDVNDSTWEIQMTWASGELSIAGMSALSYPALPALAEDSKTVKFDVDMLVTGINQTIFATAEDDLRPVMCGVYVNIENKTTTFVGTDAHKLVKCEVEMESETEASFILPKKPANLLRNILLKEEEPVEVSFDDKNVIFNLKNYTLVCRLIEGNYPNYGAVIPKANPNKVLIDRVELINGIKRVAVCSNPTTNLIKLDISNNKMELTAQDLTSATSAKDSCSCSYEGDAITIGFKSTFVVEILSNIDTPTVVIELADSTRAGVFKPVHDEKQPLSTLMLLMPMTITA